MATDADGRWYRRRRRRRAVLALSCALLAAPAMGASASGSGSSSSSACASANVVVLGSSDTQAVAYDSGCTARLFEVLTLSDTARSLNLSNLDVARIDSYPSVYTMIANDNQLETFAPEAADNDMETLYLSKNLIANLSGMRLPLRLSYLDLSDNEIATVPATAAWPDAGLLRTLILDGNAIKDVEVAAFAPLDALQSLSLSNTGLSSLDGVVLPAALTTLNATNNSFSSSSANFSNLPDALEHLDLHANQLTAMPTVVSSLSSLISLNLASNSIRSVSAVAFPPTLSSLDLSDNPLEMIEICRSDVLVFANLDELSVPSTITGACLDAKATVESIQDVAICVLEDADCPAAAAGAGKVSTSVSSSDSSASAGSSSAGSESMLTDAGASKASTFSSEAIGVVGSIAFVVGVLFCGLAFLLYRRRKREDERRAAYKRRTRTRGRSNLVSYAMELEQRSNTDEDGDGIGGGVPSDGDKHGWVFDSPQFEREDVYNPVAILEENSGPRLKAGRLLDDLLVYEIPPEEISMKRVLASALATGKRTPRALFLAEYQGFHVVVHALLRQKRPKRSEERRFLEQVRLASTLEHASVVHFIGLTYGCSSGVDGVTATTHNDRLAHNWTLGVIFEYMALGSLAAMFQAERNRREGKQFYQHGGLSSTIGSGGGNIFSWYPVFSQTHGPPNPNSDWRCKLSLALDVAMGLVYLHSCGLVHGTVCAEKVLVNEHGEAKLSALDMPLPSERGARLGGHADGASARGSIRESAKRTMRRVVGLAPTQPAQRVARLDSHAAALTPVTPTFAPAETSSPSWLEQKSDVYAFGVLLWELDTLISVEAMKDLGLSGGGLGGSGGARASSRLAAPPGREQQHQLLKFSSDCPPEIQRLARRCWSPEVRARPDAVDLQEELVRVLEGRLTTSTHVPSNWARPTNLSAVSSFSSSNFSSRSSDLDADDSASVFALSRADV